MRILHVCSWFQPVLGYSEFHLPSALQRLGHENAILTSDRYYPFPDYAATVGPILGPRIRGAGIGKELGLLTFRVPVLFEFRHHLWLRRFNSVVGEFKPQIVHVYQTFTLPTFQSALAKRRFGYGLIVRSTMEKEVFGNQSKSRRLFYRVFSATIARTLRRRVDRFTAVGEGSRDIVAKVVGVPVERVQIVPLGADCGRFQFNPADRAAVRAKLEVPDGSTLVTYAGKLLPKKDVHILAAAFRKIWDRGNVMLLLLGSGTPEFEGRLREVLGPALQDVRFLPPVPNAELAAHFSASDVAVWPSESSNAALEAAMVGLPIVVCDEVGSRQYVSAGNGLKFPRGDVGALANCLLRLAESPELRRELGERGRQHAQGTLSWDAIAQRTVDTYREVLSCQKGTQDDHAAE